jgi:hypothetical protein
MPRVDDWVDGKPDAWDYNAVLKKHEASVDRTDSWWHTLGWKHGSIGLNTEHETHARKGAALFIELWTRGFAASFADKIVDGFLSFLELQEGAEEPVNPLGYGFGYDPFQMLVEVVQGIYGVTPVICKWIPVGSSIDWPVDPAQGDPTIGLSSSLTVEKALETLIDYLAHVVIVRHFEGQWHSRNSGTVKWEEVVERIRTEFYLRMDEVVGPPMEFIEKAKEDFLCGRFSTPQECIDQLKESGD